MAILIENNTTGLEELLSIASSLPNALTLQDNKDVTPTNSTQIITPDSGYDGLEQVTVNAVETATQATPSISINSNGLITASATQTEGYVSAGTKTGTKQMTVQAAKTVTPTKSSQTAVAKNIYTTGVVTVGAIPDQYQDITTPLSELNAANGGTAVTTIEAAVDNTEAHASSQEALIAQIAEALEGKAAATPVLQAKEITPTTSQQSITPDSGYDGLSSVKVNAIPSTYVKPTTTKAATTYTPTTSNQTIVAGTYCSGVQTIKGDANLVAGNIKSGVSIFGVAGTVTEGEDVSAETAEYTEQLDELESVIDSLPDAGSGGSGKKTVTITVEQTVSYGWVGYFDELGILYSIQNGTSTIEALGGALIIPAFSLVNVVQGSAVYEGNVTLRRLLVCKEDGTTIQVFEQETG